MSAPYTHAQHARRCGDAAQRCQPLAQFVQVRMDGAACCARIAGAWDTPDGLPMWRLHFLGPVHGLWSVPVRKVVQCSGIDSRCVCASEDLPERPHWFASYRTSRAMWGRVLTPQLRAAAARCLIGAGA